MNSIAIPFAKHSRNIHVGAFNSQLAKQKMCEMNSWFDKQSYHLDGGAIELEQKFTLTKQKQQNECNKNESNKK